MHNLNPSTMNMADIVLYSYFPPRCDNLKYVCVPIDCPTSMMKKNKLCPVLPPDDVGLSGEGGADERSSLLVPLFFSSKRSFSSNEVDDEFECDVIRWVADMIWLLRVHTQQREYRTRAKNSSTIL